MGLLEEFQLNYIQAIAYFEKAHSISPENPKLKTNLSYLYTQFAKQLISQNQEEEAVNFLRKALTLLPENKEAFDLLNTL